MTTPRFELTSQGQKVSRLPTGPPGMYVYEITLKRAIPNPALHYHPSHSMLLSPVLLRGGVCMYVCMVLTYSIVCMYQPEKVVNSACGELKSLCFFLSPFAPENLVSRHGFSTVLFRPASAYSFSTLRLNMLLTHGIPPAPRDGAHLFIYTVNRHRFNPELNRITRLRTDVVTVTAKSPPAQHQWS